MTDGDTTSLETPSGDGSDAPSTKPVAGAPGDNTTLVAVLEKFTDAGFGHQLIAVGDGRIECVECGSTVGAAELDVAEIRRLEGASDPDDLMAVVAATCPKCGCSGTVILGYGPNSSTEDVAVWAELPDPDNND